MGRRPSPSTIGTIESLEPRTLLSGSTPILADTQSIAADVQSTLETRPRILYSSDAKQEFWKEAQTGQGMNLNSLKQYTSRGDMLPTPENPVRMETEFSLAAGDAGLKVVTRTDGASSGRFDNTYETGLSFTVEHNGASIYLRGTAGGQYIGTRIQFAPYLQPGKVYRLLVEDSGTGAMLSVSDTGNIVGEIQGSVPVAAEDGGIVMRKGDPAGPEVQLPSLTISHGVQRLPQPPKQEPPEALPAPAVGAVLSDAEIVRQLILEHLDTAKPEEVQPASSILYTSDAKQAFWGELQAGQGLDLNSLKQYTSRGEMLPTLEKPVRVQTEFRLASGDAGLMIVTRTDGQSSGRFNNEYAAGLAFNVEYSGASVYLRSHAGGKYIGTAIKFPGNLEPGKTYTLTAEDLGNEARLTISCDGVIVGAIRGTVPDAPTVGRVVFRAGNYGGSQIQTPSITVMHGEPGTKEIDAIFSEEDVLALLCNAEAAEAGKTKLLTSGDPRLTALQGTNYESGAVAGVERDRLYRESHFFVGQDLRTIAVRHPEYGKGNGRVDGDIEADLNLLLAAYQDVVGDALLRGIGVEVADLKGQSREQPMEMLDFVLGPRARGRYISELARYFQVTMPTKNDILAESRLLLAKNVDRLMENQAASAEAIAKQNWTDTHTGETPSAAPTGSRALELNMARGLHGAMMHTASVIGGYSAAVQQEFRTAVAAAGLNVEQIYAEAGATTYVSATPLQSGVLGIATDMEGTGDHTMEEVRKAIQNKSDSEVFSTVLGWYDPNTSLPINLAMKIGDRTVPAFRVDTVAGKLLAGLAQKISKESRESQTQIAVMAERITGISAEKFLAIAQRRNDESIGLNLQNLFITGQFGHIFSSPVPSSEPQFLSAETNQTAYQNGNMRIRFDAALNGKEIRYVDVIAPSGQSLATVRDRLFVDIPVEKVAEASAQSGSGMKLTLRAVLSDGNVITKETNAFELGWDGKSRNQELLQDMLDPTKVRPIADYAQHLGADYPALEGTPVIWNGPRAKVIHVGPKNGYGTMAVMLEIELPEQRTFQSEIEMEKLPEGVVMQTEILTQKIRVVFGHLRPSKNIINNDHADARFEEGRMTNEIVLTEEEFIQNGTILGFIESEEYGGISSGPHIHVSSYAVFDKEERWNGIAENDSALREVFIRPEEMWRVLSEYVSPNQQ